MNNPEAIKYCNETIRPLSEAMEALKVRFDAAVTKWNGGIGLNFTSAPQNELVDDGRENDGVSRLTCFQVIQFFEEMSKTSSSGPNEWNDEIINKPTVRQLTVS